MSRRFATLLLVFACSCLPLYAAEEASSAKKVVAVGKGADKDAAKARDDALADALRRAVEQGVGLFVKSEVLVENTALVESRIATKAEGFVLSYKVLDEQREGEITTVKIEALVSLKRIDEAIAELCQEMKWGGCNPRILLDITPEGKMDDSTRRAGEAVIRDKLVDEGAIVLDRQQLSEANAKLLERITRLSNDRVSAEALQLQDVADIVIKGQVSVRELGKMVPGLDTYSAEATLDLWALWIDNAIIIASKRVKATAPAFQQAQANDRAMETAANKWLEATLCPIKRVCADPGRVYQLTITQVKKAEQVDALANALQELRFTREVHVRSFEKGAARVDVVYASSALSLREEMAALRSPRLKIEGFSGRTIRLSFL